jgi:hypothetical protein
MRQKLYGILLAAALLVAGHAGAGTLVYGGQLSLQLATLPGLGVPGGGGTFVAGSGPHLSSFGVSAGAFGPASSSVAVTASMTVLSVRFSGVANTTGTFSGTGGAGLGGTMGLSGLAKICLVFDPSCAYVNVPVPLAGGFGISGSQFITGPVNITLQHTGWTTGLVATTIHQAGSTVSTAGVAGFVHGAASATSSTAAGSGMVQLVTVTKAFTSLTGSFPELPLFGVLTLQFVPEPGTLLLAGAGVLGLILVGRKNRG